MAIAHSGSVPLYIWAGPLTGSGVIPLYTFGPGPKAKGAPLFLRGTDYSTKTQEIPLYTEGTLTAGWNYEQSTISLFIKEDTRSGSRSRHVPLYIPVPSTATTTKIVPLKITGYTYQVSKLRIPLVLSNDVGKTQSASLYIFGDREDRVGGYVALESYDYTPKSKRVTLFINRPNYCMVIPMYLKTVESAPNSYIDMYINGVYITTGNIPLVIPNALSSGNQSRNLFISGF